ncbi:hypothetical protein SAMN05192563_10595 [Paraburkholderia aspalathi]|uniref:Uncharacterized protein n=1 Tax=Paraburkholderia aspalathi TaxID=1324617 RepID=A0A1I7ERM8_9BURK|nr:hypothetical protein SAMN05192563_10595 [Paraburkholderia aspalathi]
MCAGTSLRLLVDKWLMPNSSTPIRVIRFGRIHPDGTRFVRIAVLRLEGSIALYFFRHDDGTWHVVPPATRRPAIRVYANTG